jgi:group I intron endonuclease
MVIYKIENLVNGKLYIGQTRIKDTNARWAKHKYSLRQNNHGNPYLQAAYNKYGANAFKYEIIYTAQTSEELNKMETELIIKHKTLDRSFGYNLRGGGDNLLISAETREKMKIAQNDSKLLEIRSKTHKGVKKSREHVDKIRQANLRTKNKVPINRYSASGVYIDQFPSLQSCLHTLNIGESRVLRSLKTGYPTRGNYFRRGGDNRPFTNNPTPKFYKKVNQLTLSGEFIKTFNTIKEAAIALKLQSSAICNCCKGKSKQTGNYIFTYSK